MIQTETVLDVTDNTGARTAKCIKVLGGTRKRFATVGDIIVVSVQKSMAGSRFSTPKAKRDKKTLQRALIVRVAQPVRREDGSYVRFDRSACVLVDKDGNPQGTRIFGAVARELRDRKYMKIVSLANEVV